MIDLHFDLLTKLYTSYLENDFNFIENFIKGYNKDNVTGVIANMCFMSEDEMKQEYHPNYFNKNVSIVEMFITVKKLLEKYFPKDIDIVLCIEGCDYIEDTKQLDVLYDLGLRAIVPVWNEENKYGSGNRTDKGLTLEGKKLIWHAFEKGIGVDLSHANKKTFNDIINLAHLAKEQWLLPIVYASHSNVYSLCERDRNLTDDQLLKIKKIGGIVGVFSNRSFVLKGSLNKDVPKDELVSMYIKHIKYLENLFGNLDNIALSTDDMTFCADKNLDYYNCPIFSYSTIRNDLEIVLKKEYSPSDVKNLLEGNAKKLMNKLLKKKEIKNDRYKIN